MKLLIKLSLLTLISISGLKASYIANSFVRDAESTSHYIVAQISINGQSTYEYCQDCKKPRGLYVRFKVTASKETNLKEILDKAVMRQIILKKSSIQPETLEYSFGHLSQLALTMTGRDAGLVLEILATTMGKLKISCTTADRDSSLPTSLDDYFNVERKLKMPVVKSVTS